MKHLTFSREKHLTYDTFQIAGIAVGFNLVFESNDPITVVCFTSVVINMLPYTLSLLVNLCPQRTVYKIMTCSKTFFYNVFWFLYLCWLQDKRKAGMFNAYLSGFTLVCFVLGLLVSHPKVPVNTNVMFPKLSGESAYSLMALLGTNIIVHNFYTHSSVVQVNFQHPVLMFFFKTMAGALPFN